MFFPGLASGQLHDMAARRSRGSVIVDSGGRKTIYPITAEIEADDVIEPQAIVADFLGWTEKYVFGR
jgi:hypothetical protein